MLQRREDYSMDEMLEFVFSIYKATGEKYPLLEWMDDKPAMDDFPFFKSIYEPFLIRRMEEEFDELYVWGEKSIEATAALVYKFEGKSVEWIPSSLKNEKNVFIEFFMVSPSLWGRGYGKKVLSFLLEKIKSMGKDAYVSTSRHIDAFDFYRKNGFKEVEQHGIFVIMKYDWGSGDL